MTLLPQRLSHLLLSTFALISTGLLITAWVEKPAPATPNVVLFFMDDMGYGDLSVTGALDYTTPNLDRLAADGSRFTNFLVAQAVCSASRAALMTGCYPNRLGISGALGPNSPIGLNPNEETLADLLKEKGYATGIFGKWHLGDKQAFLPLQQGFDEYYGVPYSHDMWPQHPTVKFPPLHWIEGNEPKGEIKNLDDASHITSTVTEKAVSFIRKHKKDPFFLYVPHPLPHVPLAVSDKFKGKTARGLFGDVMTELDWSIGQILGELKQQGLDKNTLVIFISDNGPWLNYGDHAGSAGGFREGKGTSFEGGHRVPCLVRWPGVVPAGRVSNKLLTTMDILPTVAKICGARLPKQRIDGVDWLALLKGDETVTPRDHFYYYYRKNSLEAVRQGDWKLVFGHPGRTYEGFLPGQNGKPGPSTETHEFPKALYDLRRDPSERYDVLEQHPEIVAKLEKIAEEARTDLGDDIQQRTGANVREPGQVTN
ncbi:MULTISPECIES: sulfatase family protein [Spirosoma]|uniref:Sulfatase n=1 Tax=Spirosoma liriopis TaxID=2937440 RepID=A0ABT0HMD9_9BACT|nr:MULTISPECIES: sulfatase [Spirosoma]MCK8492725.1 sulfatase [Spirosoma liriopis]UHG92192.1 sulfatase [Spirosoma oryzicola]